MTKSFKGDVKVLWRIDLSFETTTTPNMGQNWGMISIWKKHDEIFSDFTFLRRKLWPNNVMKQVMSENFPVLAKMISLWAEIEAVGTPKMIKS